MPTVNVKDPRNGRVIGTISESGSSLIAKDSHGRELARYDTKSDYTKSGSRREKGNHLEAAIHLAVRDREDRQRQEAEKKATEADKRRKELEARDARDRESKRVQQEQKDKHEAEARKRLEHHKEQVRLTAERRAADRRRDEERKRDAAIQRERDIAADKLRLAEQKAAEQEARLQRQLQARRQPERPTRPSSNPRVEPDTDLEPESEPVRSTPVRSSRGSSRPRPVRRREANRPEPTAVDDLESEEFVSHGEAAPTRRRGVLPWLAGLILAAAVGTWFAVTPRDAAGPSVSDRAPAQPSQTESAQQNPGSPADVVPASDQRWEVFHRHGRADFPELVSDGVPPSGFCRGMLALSDGGLVFVTVESSDMRRDNLFVPAGRIKNVERRDARQLHLATEGQGDWDFFATDDVLRSVSAALSGAPDRFQEP